VTVLVRLHLFTHQNHALNGEEQQGEERDYTKKGGVSPYRLFSVLGNDSPLNLVVSTLFWGSGDSLIALLASPTPHPIRAESPEARRRPSPERLKTFDSWPVFFRREFHRNWPFLAGFAVTGFVICRMTAGFTEEDLKNSKFVQEHKRR
jgi:hypothetical protein